MPEKISPEDPTPRFVPECSLDSLRACGQVAITDVSSERPYADRVPTGIVIDRTNPTSNYIEQAMIARGGVIPYSEFMNLSLFGPDGYYSVAHARIGGQFVTCPELFQEFNFSLGEAIRKIWMTMDRPSDFQIVEMGAGNGTLAKDMLVWARETQPDFYDALQYTIVEYGDLIQKQQKTVSGNTWYLHERSRVSTPEQHNADFQKVQWLRSSAIDVELGEVEGVFVSNELPDTFPVEIVRVQNGKLQQKYITLENDEWVEVWGVLSTEVLDYTHEFGLVVAEGCQEPVNMLAIKWQQHLSNVLKRGAIITIDYGQDGPNNCTEATRTFPQTKGAEYSSPGRVDITTDVNFAALRQAAEQGGLRTAFSSTQAAFLCANGFPSPERLEAGFSDSAREQAREAIGDYGEACRALVMTKNL